MHGRSVDPFAVAGLGGFDARVRGQGPNAALSAHPIDDLHTLYNSLAPARWAGDPEIAVQKY